MQTSPKVGNLYLSAIACHNTYKYVQIFQDYCQYTYFCGVSRKAHPTILDNLFVINP
ncbi:hypothetical protein [Nostoc sp.]|uniref:hypothetical protein n=1 Tax=Nostoc sp. TaxID=1180 RepID=UPI002FF6FE99